jgi:hypothetical protein
MSGYGFHWTQCRGGGGGGLVALAVVLVAAAAVLHAIWHTLVEVAEIAALTVVSVAGLAAVAGIGLLAHRARSDRPGRPITGRVVSRGYPRNAASVGGFPHNRARSALRTAHPPARPHARADRCDRHPAWLPRGEWLVKH